MTRDLTGDWGHDLTVVSIFSADYEPGFYGLFNSAIENGFRGQVLAIVSEPDRVVSKVTHPQLRVEVVRSVPADHMAVWRLKAVAALPDGAYVLMGADFIVERPCGFLIEPIESALVASSEPDRVYDDRDVFLYHQCRALGVPNAVGPNQYVNADFLGFRFPRDRQFICDWRDGSERVLRGTFRQHQQPLFMFAEQDVLNILIRQPSVSAFTISTRQLEFGNRTGGLFHDRPFPWQRQQGLKPADREKYLIHGTNLRRPWLTARHAPGWRGPSERVGALPLYRSIRKRLFPYERAWAYYTCRNDVPIPVSLWAGRYGFSAYRQPLWRWAHGLAR